VTKATGGTPAGRRTSLLVRMANAARDADVVPRRIHLVVAIDRLLVRLREAAPGRWVVKGGYANQLRRPYDARFTEDLDLKVDAAIETAPELLASGFAVDLADDFSYEAAAAPTPLEGPPGGGLRFVVVARLAGTELVHFKVDVSAADVSSASSRPISPIQSSDALASGDHGSPSIPSPGAGPAVCACRSRHSRCGRLEADPDAETVALALEDHALLDRSRQGCVRYLHEPGRAVRLRRHRHGVLVASLPGPDGLSRPVESSKRRASLLCLPRTSHRVPTPRAFDRSPTISAVPLDRGRPLDDLVTPRALEERDR